MSDDLGDLTPVESIYIYIYEWVLPDDSIWVFGACLLMLYLGRPVMASCMWTQQGR